MDEFKEHMKVMDHWQEMRKAFQLMADRNDILQDTHGNLSVFFDKNIIIKPSGMPYSDIARHGAMCQFIVQDDGSLKDVRNNDLKPSVDLPHHLEIYKRNPEIRSICHTHSPYATAFAIAGLDIRCMSTEQADYFGGDIYCTQYADLDKWSMMVTGWGNQKALLLQNHGVLTFGKNPIEAVNLAIQLENVARKNHLALNIPGSRVGAGLHRDEVKKWHDRYNNVYGQR